MQNRSLKILFLTIFSLFGNYIQADQTFDDLQSACALPSPVALTAKHKTDLNNISYFNINFNQTHGFMFGVQPGILNPWTKGDVTADLSSILTSTVLDNGVQFVLVGVDRNNNIICPASKASGIKFNQAYNFNLYLFDLNNDLIEVTAPETNPIVITPNEVFSLSAAQQAPAAPVIGSSAIGFGNTSGTTINATISPTSATASYPVYVVFQTQEEANRENVPAVLDLCRAIYNYQSTYSVAPTQESIPDQTTAVKKAAMPGLKQDGTLGSWIAVNIQGQEYMLANSPISDFGGIANQHNINERATMSGLKKMTVQDFDDGICFSLVPIVDDVYVYVQTSSGKYLGHAKLPGVTSNDLTSQVTWSGSLMFHNTNLSANTTFVYQSKGSSTTVPATISIPNFPWGPINNIQSLSDIKSLFSKVKTRKVTVNYVSDSRLPRFEYLASTTTPNMPNISYLFNNNKRFNIAMGTGVSIVALCADSDGNIINPATSQQSSNIAYIVLLAFDSSGNLIPGMPKSFATNSNTKNNVRPLISSINQFTIEGNSVSLPTYPTIVNIVPQQQAS